MEYNKLVIGEKQYVGKQNADTYIDIDLSRTIDTIKKNTADNIFDFQKQYILERNSSMKFCIYGIVESRYGNCDNVAIKIHVADSDNIDNSVAIWSPNINTAITSAFTITTTSKPLSGNQNAMTKNLYGAAKGSYFLLFEIDKSILNDKKSKSIYLKIFDPLNELFGDFSIPIIYFNSDGEFIEFGTENAEIDNNNEIIEINNNFPFFYDKHWVKLNIEPNGPAKIYFTDSETTVIESQPIANINVTLDEPSLFGLESATVQINYATNIYGDNLTTATFGSDFNFVEPILSWEPGEQIKSFPISILHDFFVETDIETISFRLIPLSNCRIEPTDQYDFTLRIKNEYQTVTAQFLNTNTFINEPSPSVNSLSTSIDITFNDTVSAPDQSIIVEFDQSSSTAIIGQDFYLSAANPLSKSVVLSVPQWSNSIPLTIYVNSNNLYDINRTIKLKVIQNSQYIIPGNEIILTLVDSIKYNYVRYIIPKNDITKNGIFKTVYNGSSLSRNSTTILEKTTELSGITYGVKNLYLTDDFSFKLKIKNLGERIIWNNEIINTNDLITLPYSLSSISSDIMIDLPTNSLYNSTSESYTHATYEFLFSEISEFYPVDTPASEFSNVDKYNNFEKSVTITNATGATFGSSKLYLITELNNTLSAYDTSALTCSANANNFNSTIKYNGVILVPKNIGKNNTYTSTTTTLYFSDRRIKNECATTGNTLPVGLTHIPTPPFVEKYSFVKFGQIYVQADYVAANTNQKLILGAYENGTQQSAWKFFKTWNGTDFNIKNKIEFVITNLGDRDVIIDNKNIYINDSMVYNSTDFDFQNLNILFPSNVNYNASTNSFADCRYHLKIKNVPLYNDAGNYTGKICDLDLGEMNVPSDTPLQISTYYIEMEIHNIMLAANINLSPSCGLNIFANTTNLVSKNVKTNNIFVFGNSGTQITAIRYLLDTQVAAFCPSDPILYQII